MYMSLSVFVIGRRAVDTGLLHFQPAASQICDVIAAASSRVFTVSAGFHAQVGSLP